MYGTMIIIFTDFSFFYIMQQEDIVSFAQQLIAIESVAANPKGLEDALTLALSQLSGYTIERFERNGVKSALVYNTPTRPKKFKVVLNTHLDVIPGKKEQYIPRIQGKKLFGVGAMDMKANLACAIAAFKDVAGVVKYPLALQLVTDEEIGGFDGTKYQVEQGVRADTVLATEPTSFDIVHQTKGILWLKVHARGKTAHGAYPWRGENALRTLITFLNALEKIYPTPKKESWVTTVNVSRIETNNQTFNKIPDEATVSLDIRYVPKDDKTILSRIRKVLPKGCTLEVIAKEPLIDTDKRNFYLLHLQKACENVLRKKTILRGAQGSSDARHFTQVGSSGIEFGPIGVGIGSDNEWVDIPSLSKYHEILKQFLISLDTP